MKHRIMLVEDEEHLQEAIAHNLESEGHVVVSVNNGKAALKLIREERFSLVVLDVMIPELDGFRVCEAIRLSGNNVPILFLTARGNSEDRVYGLKIGGDDYLSKPFNLEEFLLRVKKLLGRSLQMNAPKTESTIFSFEGNMVNFQNFEAVSFSGQQIPLTKKETGLLKLLTEHANEVVSREMILETVWGYDIYPSTRTIDNFILAFRKYFERNPKNPKHFLSVRGVGYKFVLEGNDK